MKRAWQFFVTLVALTVLSPLLQATEQGIDEGIEYKLLTPPVRTTEKDKVEVVEMFWYGCPHCYSLEPKMEKWKATIPDNVVFKRVPAIFPNRTIWETHAKAFYTAELLGVLDKIHQPLFDAIHKNKQKIFSEAALASFFAQYGVDQQTFKETFNSFGVQMKVNVAKDLTRRYQIDGVPAMVVNGRYRTHASLTNGQAGMFKVVDFLIDKESKRKGK